MKRVGVTRNHARPAQPPREPASPYAFSLAEYALCAVAALVAAPLTYVFLVLFLTAFDL